LQPFSIFKTGGDGGLYLVEGAKDLETAKVRVEELAKSWPGRYVIVNQETGDRLFISAGDEKIH
jgi:hypothetical protein